MSGADTSRTTPATTAGAPTVFPYIQGQWVAQGVRGGQLITYIEYSQKEALKLWHAQK